MVRVLESFGFARKLESEKRPASGRRRSTRSRDSARAPWKLCAERASAIPPEHILGGGFFRAPRPEGAVIVLVTARHEASVLGSFSDSRTQCHLRTRYFHGEAASTFEKTGASLPRVFEHHVAPVDNRPICLEVRGMPAAIVWTRGTRRSRSRRRFRWSRREGRRLAGSYDDWCRRRLAGSEEHG